MRIEQPILSGEFRRRYKRFLADVLMENGEILTVHCPNSGAMTGCAIPGARAYISDSQNPKRKLRYTLEEIETDTASICVNTHRANGLVEEAIRTGLIPELSGFTTIQQEVRYGSERSRIDLLLKMPSHDCYVEVKNVTLDGENGVVAFPDAVTKRHEISRADFDGRISHRAALMCRSNRRRSYPASDPIYAETLEMGIKRTSKSTLQVDINAELSLVKYRIRGVINRPIDGATH